MEPLDDFQNIRTSTKPSTSRDMRVYPHFSPKLPYFSLFLHGYGHNIWSMLLRESANLSIVFHGTTPPPYFEGAQYKKTRLRNEQVHTDQFLEPVFAKI